MMQRFAEGKKGRAIKEFETQLEGAGFSGDLQSAKNFMSYYIQLHDAIDDAENHRDKARETIMGTGKMLALSAVQMARHVPQNFGQQALPQGATGPQADVAAYNEIYRMANAIYNKTYPEQSLAASGRGA